MEARLGLPEGEYDVALALSAKQYTSSGGLTSVGDETDSVYGDVIEVNGQPWPFLSVEPRKYRFRILNTALSRTFILGVLDGASGTNVSFQVVASDSGFMSSPVTTTELTIGMAERWEVIVDFSSYSDRNLTLVNQRKVFDVAELSGDRPCHAVQCRLQRFFRRQQQSDPRLLSHARYPTRRNSSSADVQV